MRRAPPRKSRPANSKTLWIALAAGAALVLIVGIAIAVSSGRPPTSPAPDPPAQKKAVEPSRPRPKTLDERIDELAEHEKSMKESYRTRHRLWSALLPEAKGTRHERSMRDHLESLERAANKAYVAAYRPVQEEIRNLKPREAQERLLRWRVPEELDIDGSHAAEVKKELAVLDERGALEEACAKIDPATDPEPALRKFLQSPHVSVRAEAESALLRLRFQYALESFRRKMDARRAAALGRIESVRKEIERDRVAEQARVGSWEKRLQETSKKKPIPLRQLGIDLDQTARIEKFDGARLGLAGDGFEFGIELGELPPAALGNLLLQAADPSSAREQLEAGKLAIRHEAYDAAAKLVAQARKLDASLTDTAPDVERIRGGTLAVSGGELHGRYDFQSDEQAKDFEIPSGVKLKVRNGQCILDGQGLFCGLLRNVSFVRRARLTFEPLYASEDAAYVMGARLERAWYLVVLVDPRNRAHQILRLEPEKKPQILQEGACESVETVEIAFDTPRVDVKIGGKPLWSGTTSLFDTMEPLLGGNDFRGTPSQVAFRSLEVRGAVTGRRLLELRAERSAILEAELAKEWRTTQTERGAEDLVGTRTFGERPVEAIPLEKELAAIQPKRVGEILAQVRRGLREIDKIRDDEAWWSAADAVTELLAQAAHDAPWYPLTRYYLAEWKAFLGEPNAALLDLTEAVRQVPLFVEARLAQAQLLLEDRRVSEAGKALDGALESVPDLARARLLRALIHYYEGRKDPAVEESELAIRLQPSNLALRREAKRLRNVAAGPRWSQIAELDTEHYRLRTEVPRREKKGQAQSRLARFGGHLGAARGFFATLAPGKVEAVMKPLVYLFLSPEGYYLYADFTSEDRLEWTAGYYMPLYRQLLLFEEESESATLQTLTHEAFHEYLHSVASHVPVWLNEGMAEYAAGIEVRDGRVAATGLVMKDRLRTLQRALDGGWQGIPFEVILRESQERFYANQPDLQYAQAWSMVHFFRHHAQGKYADLLARYVKLLTDGGIPSDAYRATFAKENLAALRQEWLAHVRSLNR